MVLKLKETESKKIALRHYANRLNVLIDDVQEASDSIGLKYIRAQTNKTLEEVRQVREEFVKLNTQVDDKDLSQIKEEIVANEIKYKEQALTYINRLRSYAVNLKNHKNKFNGLISSLLNLAQSSATTFIDLSEDKKNQKVAELGENVPTFAQIASVLRISELQNGVLINQTNRLLTGYAQNINEQVEEAGLEGGVDIEEKIQHSLDLAGVRVNAAAVAMVANLFVINEDRNVFVHKTLRLTTQNFFNRNHDKFVAHMKEELIIS